MTVLGALPGGGFSVAAGIDNRGIVAGWSGSSNGNLRAVIWKQGVITDLGTLGGSGASATAINNRGQVVGQSSTASGPPIAFVWTP